MEPNESPAKPDSGEAATMLESLRARAFAVGVGERPRRREELVELAEEKLSLPREDAEAIYDISREEGLEPALAFELVRSGLAVCLTPETTGDAPVIDTGNPQWLEAAPPAEEADWERRLRATLRRMRGLVEKLNDDDAAFAAFVREPDVGACDFPRSD